MMRVVLILFLSVPIFGSTLNELTAYALKHSSVAKQSRSQMMLSELKRKESRAEQFGELNLVGNYTHYNTERTLAPLSPTSMSSGQPIVTTKDLLGAGIQYSIPLFTGYAQTKEIEINDIASKMAYARLKLTKEQIVYNIRSLYLSILIQKEISKAQKSYTNALSRLAKQIAYEVKLGKKAEIDLLKAKADFESSKIQQEILRANIETTSATLSALVGKDIGRISPLKIKPKNPRYSVSKLIKKSRQLSRVQIEDLALKKADKKIEKSKSARYPQVNLDSYWGKNYGEDLKTDNWDNETLWQIGLNLKYNIIDFGKRDINIEKAKVAKMDAVSKREQALLDLKKEIIQAVEKIKLSYAEYRGNDAQYRLSRKSEKIERVRYENDAATLNDLLLAKGKTLIARAKFIESKYDYQKSKYYLDYVMERGEKNEK